MTDSSRTFRQLGRSGLTVSAVGLGTNNFGGRIGEEASIAVVEAALEHGITLFDTADIYGGGDSERFLGKALRGRRDQVIIATKFGMEAGEGPYARGGSRRHIRRAVESSLRRLGTDYIDLYQFHEPDPNTPIEETLSALNDLIHDGKIRYMGSSQFAGWQVADADWTSRVNHQDHFISAQNHYNLLSRGIEQDLIPACIHFGVGVLPFYPLEGGLLTGKYRRGQAPPAGTRIANSPNPDRYLNDANLAKVEALRTFGDREGVTLLHIAFGWLLAQPPVASVIAGATKPEQVAANVEAGAWVPSREQLAEIDRLTSVI